MTGPLAGIGHTDWFAPCCVRIGSHSEPHLYVSSLNALRMTSSSEPKHDELCMPGHAQPVVGCCAKTDPPSSVPIVLRLQRRPRSAAPAARVSQRCLLVVNRQPLGLPATRIPRVALA
ncbi:hypothetical protein BTHE_1983 [Bifidobacterium thermophilum]|nr:hypothetical protein BTHE_1983 [Bifidobacterium thermophilum]